MSDLAGGVYGSPVLAFPEQFESITYFDMDPLQNSGFGPRRDVRTIEGVIQCTEGRRVIKSNGNIVRTRHMRLWTEAVLFSGKFVEFTENGRRTTYRLKGDNVWTREGGFIAYDLERVVGADGEQSDPAEPSVGEGRFG